MTRILVADDNSNIQKMAALALKGAGVEVIAVGNGEAAVRKLPELQPDLVLADVFMPVRNGYEVCEFIKRDARFAHIPVILLVGAFDPLDEREAQRVRADGVLKKPFVPPDPLVNMVKSLLVKAASERLAAVPEPEPAPVAVAGNRVPAPSVPAPAAPAPGAVLVEESPEEPENAREESSLPNVELEEHDQLVAFSALLDSPAIEADAETTVTASRDPNLGEPSFWSPPPEPDPSVEEEPTEHTWGAENDGLPRPEEAALLHPMELAAESQTEVHAWVPQAPPPNHFSMEQLSTEEEAREVAEGSAPADLGAAPSAQQELPPALIPSEEILSPSAGEESSALVEAHNNDAGTSSSAFDLDGLAISSDTAAEVLSPVELAAEPTSPPEIAPLASLPLADLERADGVSEPDAVGRRGPLLEVLGIEPDDEFVVAEEWVPESLPIMKADARSELRSSPEVVTAVLETEPAAGDSPHSLPVPLYEHDSISRNSRVLAVPDALQGTAAAPELTLTPISAAELGASGQEPLDPSAIAAIVDRVIERMQPRIVDAVIREILRPIVEALVERELKLR